MRSLLFVSGSRPDRISKALASDADHVCIDLEDSVPPDGKSAARQAALEALREDRTGKLGLRINGLGTRYGLADLIEVAEQAPGLSQLMIPKIESADAIAMARSVLDNDGCGLIPLIETPQGLRNAHRIAGAAGVTAVMFGGADFATELGVTLSWEPLQTARGQFLLACAEHGVPAIDVPYINLDDLSGLSEEAHRAKSLGFRAKAAIHPQQIAILNQAFGPTEAEIEEARAAQAAFAAAGGHAIRFRGRMLEAPIMNRYLKILQGVSDA